jgi:hypothetical protein
MQLFKDAHLTKPELLSNATTIDSPKLYQKKQAQQKNGQDLDSTSDDNDQLTKAGGQTIF